MAQGQASRRAAGRRCRYRGRGVRRHLLRPDPVRAFAGNALVLLVPRLPGCPSTGWPDLARTEVQRIAMARPPSAPAGRYARQAIDAARLWASVQRKIVSTDSAQTALELLLRDEVDAALVYHTDALSAAAPRAR
jgi:molybdate transport system substrate-binding protein